MGNIFSTEEEEQKTYTLQDISTLKQELGRIYYKGLKEDFIPYDEEMYLYFTMKFSEEIIDIFTRLGLKLIRLEIGTSLLLSGLLPTVNLWYLSQASNLLLFADFLIMDSS